jgi:signal transduction histidine kinase
MNELLLITVGYLTSSAIIFGFGVFVLLQKERKWAHIMLFLMCTFLALYQFLFVLAANATDPKLAYWLWFGNLVDICFSVFYFHFIILALDILKRWKNVLIGAYLGGGAIILTAFLRPALFLPRVVPKLYFPTYLDAGPLYYVMFFFFTAVFILSFVANLAERRKLGTEGKQRADYYFFAALMGCVFGFTAFALVFNLPVDPLPSTLLFLYPVIMVYGMVKKDLLGIRVVIQRSAVFTVAVAGIAGILTAVSLLSQYLAPLIPGFFYIVPLIAALASVTAGYIYWSKVQEAEKLKYEFITVAAHKFRTPLTRIRWASEALLTRTDLPADAIEFVKRTRESDLELIGLSNLLMDAARMDRENYTYAKSALDLTPVVEEALLSFQNAAKDKGITLTFTPPASLPQVKGDRERLISAMNVILENAVAYTPKGGTITVSLTGMKDEIQFSVSDTGIGVTEDEKKHIFKKFFRTDRARHADTEGVGLGLHMAKSIIERHRGTLGAESAGIGKGSTFWFTLPALKS